MLYVLADTSVWLDLSKDTNGQKLIVAVRMLIHRGFLTLLVPEIVLEEFERNRSRVEADMTRGLSATFRRVRDEIEQYGQEKKDAALIELDNLTQRVPLIKQIATRNFEDVHDLLAAGAPLSLNASTRPPYASARELRTPGPRASRSTGGVRRDVGLRRRSRTRTSSSLATLSAWPQAPCLVRSDASEEASSMIGAAGLAVWRAGACSATATPRLRAAMTGAATAPASTRRVVLAMTPAARAAVTMSAIAQRGPYNATAPTVVSQASVAADARRPMRRSSRATSWVVRAMGLRLATAQP
jgi:hypothetical protein